MTAPPVGRPDPRVIHPFAYNSLGGLFVACGQTITTGTVAWPAVNRALYVPFWITERRTYNVAFIVNGANRSATATFDVGLYAVDGTRLYSTGALIAQSATVNAVSVQSAAVATTLDPGLYYMACICSASATTSEVQSNPINSESLRMGGMLQSAEGSAVLPATATFAAVASSFLPFFGFAELATF